MPSIPNITTDETLSEDVNMRRCSEAAPGSGDSPTSWRARRWDLVRLWPEWSSDVIPAHALYPSHRSLSAKVRVFVDVLVAHLRAGDRGA